MANFHFNQNRRIKIKSPALERPPRGGHSIYNENKVRSYEAENALNAMTTREMQMNQTSRAKDFFVIRPDWISEKKSPLRVGKVLERLFAQGNLRSYEVDNALDVLMQSDKQMDRTSRAKEFFFIHPDWVSEKKNPLRVAKGLGRSCNQGSVRSYETNNVLNMVIRREIQLNQASRAKEFFIIHPDWVSEKKRPLRA